MSSSPFVFPHGDGRQALHGMGVQSSRAEKEIPASVLEAVRPLVPVRTDTVSDVWTCPGSLGASVWRSPVVQPEMPEGRRFGIHFIEVTGGTGVFRGTDSLPPWLLLFQDDRKVDRRFPDQVRMVTDGYLEYDYGYTATTRSVSSPTQWQLRAYVLGGDVGSGGPPSAEVRNLSLSVTSLWF